MNIWRNYIIKLRALGDDEEDSNNNILSKHLGFLENFSFDYLTQKELFIDSCFQNNNIISICNIPRNQSENEIFKVFLKHHCIS